MLYMLIAHDDSNTSKEIKTNIVYISNKFPRLRPMNHESSADPAPDRRRHHNRCFPLHSENAIFHLFSLRALAI